MELRGVYGLVGARPSSPETAKILQFGPDTKKRRQTAQRVVALPHAFLFTPLLIRAVIAMRRAGINISRAQI
jgi:hypothetical protein